MTFLTGLLRGFGAVVFVLLLYAAYYTAILLAAIGYRRYF